MFCKGDMRKATAPVHIDRNNVHIQLDRVPAWVCIQCGEPYFEEEEVNAIQTLIQTVDQQTEKLMETV
jgi:YgiT-type zinc finger domain-containing protein